MATKRMKDQEEMEKMTFMFDVTNLFVKVDNMKRCV